MIQTTANFFKNQPRKLYCILKLSTLPAEIAELRRGRVAILADLLDHYNPHTAPARMQRSLELSQDIQERIEAHRDLLR